MSLKKPTGDMYPFIDAIWNPVSGKCFHDCSYCYVKRIMNRTGLKQNSPHLNVNEFHCKMGIGKTIFVCSGCDLFAPDVPDEYILMVINHTLKFWANKYIFQTKNPERIIPLAFCLSADIHKICTTIETDSHYACMGNTPPPNERALAMQKLSIKGFETMVTIEPIMDFSLKPMLRMIKMTGASQVNIGADTGNNHLIEPPKDKILELISKLEKFTEVVQKKNLRRIIGE